ncbi:MAG: CPXCG motif-containing cysteine-rich protein [Idiomarina sp.]
MSIDNELYDAALHCPFCGHQVHVDIDASQGNQDYKDECPDCGNEIHLQVVSDKVRDKIIVRVDSDDENFY